MPERLIHLPGTLRTRIVFAITATMLFAAVPATFTLLHRTASDVLDTERHAINTVTAAVVPSLLDLAVSDEPYALERALTPMRENPLIAGITIHDRTGAQRYAHAIPQPGHSLLTRWVLGKSLQDPVRYTLPENPTGLSAILVQPAMLGLDAVLTHSLAVLALVFALLTAVAVFAADWVARRHVRALRPAVRWPRDC